MNIINKDINKTERAIIIDIQQGIRDTAIDDYVNEVSENEDIDPEDVDTDYCDLYDYMDTDTANLFDAIDFYIHGATTNDNGTIRLHENEDMNNKFIHYINKAYWETARELSEPTE